MVLQDSSSLGHSQLSGTAFGIWELFRAQELSNESRICIGTTTLILLLLGSCLFLIIDVKWHSHWLLLYFAPRDPRFYEPFPQLPCGSCPLVSYSNLAGSYGNVGRWLLAVKLCYVASIILESCHPHCYYWTQIYNSFTPDPQGELPLDIFVMLLSLPLVQGPGERCVLRTLL